MSPDPNQHDQLPSTYPCTACNAWFLIENETDFNLCLRRNNMLCKKCLAKRLKEIEDKVTALGLVENPVTDKQLKETVSILSDTFNPLDEIMKASRAIQYLTFAQVSEINLARSIRWHPGGIEEWSISQWALAMMGEAGEVCDAIKKLNSLETGAKSSHGPQKVEEAMQAIATEIGDTYMYLNLLAIRCGIDIRRAICDTFNRVSIREGFPERLPAGKTDPL